jgi:hypothetical protein
MRGIQQFIRDRRPEKRGGNDHIPHGKRRRQDQCPPGVQQSQILHHQVGGNQPPAEEQGEYEQHHDESASHQVLPRQWISRKNGQHHIQGRTNNGVKQ